MYQRLRAVVATVRLSRQGRRGPQRAAATLAAILTVAILGASGAASAQCPTPPPAPTGPALWIPDQVAAPGAPATITVILAAGGAQIAGVQTDLVFATSAPIAAKANGRPNCTVNPDIDKTATSFSFRPIGCSGAACTAVRAIVLATDNTAPIPDSSALFTCTVNVGTGVSGSLAYTLSGVILADPFGRKVTDAGDQNGEICLEPSQSATSTPTLTSTRTPTVTPTWTPTPTPTWTPTPTPTWTSTPTSTWTPTPTSTWTPTPTSTLTPTPTLTLAPTPTPACSGDCGGNGEVTIDEVITLVNIVLDNQPPSACPQGITGGSPADITLIIKAVGYALNNCPA